MESLSVRPFAASYTPQINAALTPGFERWQILQWMQRNTQPILSDNWEPACGGTETEFRTRTGYRLLYCWQPSTGRHAYINLDTDIALSDEEARAALALY